MRRVGGSPRADRELAARMQRLGVHAGDVEERFVRSGGPGGQNVNKLSTCVVLRHRPSGLEVRCQRERSQALNRFLAWRLLLDRLEAQWEARRKEETHRLAKLRRQQRKRSQQGQARLLREKRLRTLRKSLRRALRPRDVE